MTPLTKPCPKCRAPILLVEGVKEGVCPSCRRGYKSMAGLLQLEGDKQWPRCNGGRRIGDTWIYGGKSWTVFAAVDWRDNGFHCDSSELYLMANDGDELSLESELDDNDRTVWWLETDVTADVREEKGALIFKGERWERHGTVMSYTAKAIAGCFDSRYDVNESKLTQWFSQFQGSLDQRLPRIGRTEELGRTTYFLMGAVQPPGLRTSYALASGARQVEVQNNILPIVVTVVSIALMLALNLLFSVTAQDRRVFDAQGYDGRKDHHWVSEHITLGGHTSNVRADLNTTLTDGWLDAVLCLVSTATSERYCTVAKAARWRDGSGDAKGEAWFSAVPPGEYVLETQTDSEQANQNTLNYGITLTRDAKRSDYFWWGMALLLGVPLAALGVKTALEYAKPEQILQWVLIILAVAFMIWLDT